MRPMIATYRKKVGLSQAKLAAAITQRLGYTVNRVTISHIENGKWLPTLEEAEAIATALETIPSHVFGQEVLTLMVERRKT